jgi:DNA-binding response OmpR family regulator
MVFGRGCVSKSVLIVEDEPFIVEALSFLLKREGLQVSVFTDGEGCVEHIQSITPNLVILDMMLPNKSGMQILEELRGIDKFANLPVLMLTAKGQKKDRIAAEEAGVSLFMTKPFANKEIIENVHRLLEK